jgi:3-hydroxyacyl-[acyl-carrier-protein] dehydratase
MPPQFLFDISGIDLDKLVYDQEYVRTINPQRGDMEQLNGIVWLDAQAERLVGLKEVRHDEFWVAGHIPGRPLYPGVLMIEAAAQCASFYSRKIVGWQGFIGFGGANNIRFRQQVTPGQRLYLLSQKTQHRHRRIHCLTQGIVNGTMVFECEIIGTQI